MSYRYYRDRPSLLGRLFRLILALAVAYAAVLGMSAYRIHGWVSQATTSYEAFEQSFDAGNYESARNAIDKVAQNVANISKEAHSWYWDLVNKVPYLGEDVTCAQQLSNIADNLANNALLPVLNNAESALNDLSQVSGVIQALTNARNVVSMCRSDFEQLPASHFARLNDLATQLQNAVVNTDDVFNKLSVVLDIANLFV